MVNFALQFEGNPYVYGGTSLTNGADCSGFVMSVFANFGYSLPRVAAAQCEASTKKDISQLEPGDLVFYGSGYIDHVALYIGDGKIIHARYDKFRQINRFLEFIEDILPRLSRDREITILDFGCGKSYLTFAMYYYLRELKGYDVNIIGLDLKTDVIEKCNSLALRYGYEKLHFYHGDIADYEGVSCVDMVVTLHACDTATDYALAKAVEWGAEVILSVPCCQHEVNKQIKNEMLEPVLRYGILKERMSALITDAVRADLLESKGYDTQILEFIDMEHTPKNLLIRAVRTGKRSDQGKVEKMLAALNIHPTLDRLLNEKEQEGSVR